MGGSAIKGQKFKGLIFVISGPSGSGKTTLLDRLPGHGELKNRIARSVSFATRPKRPGEKEGANYFFISEKQFRQKRQANKILEWTRYSGYHYATPKDFVETQLKTGRHVILCLDLKGASKIKRLYPKNTVTIFVMPPSLGALRERIKKRCEETKEDEIRKRLKLARREMLFSHRYDYCLVNKGLADTARNLKNIVLRKIKEGV